MDLIGSLSHDVLLSYFRRKKTEMSCMDQPLTFLNQLRDHDLVSENLYQRVVKMKTKEQKKKGVYEVLNSLETSQPGCVETFWRSVFTDHIMQLYPTLRLLRDNLMDEYFQFKENQPKKDMKENKVKKRSCQKSERNTSKTEEEEEYCAGTSQSVKTSVKKKPQKSINRSLSFSERQPDMESHSEGKDTEGKAKDVKETVKNMTQKRKRKECEVGEEEQTRTYKIKTRVMKKKGKCQKPIYAVSSEDRDGSSYCDNRGVDTSIFDGDTLSVQCGSVIGVLQKDRFVSGSKGKCIRTEEKWLTPAEFIRLNPDLRDGMWKRDITCKGQPLSYLLQLKILQVHALQCMCHLCSETDSDRDDQTNDDHCFMCGERGVLLCCDGCPRSFHRGCHIPTPPPGDDWLCTFCVLKKSQEWRYTDQPTMTERQVLQSKIVVYKMECQYLLMILLKADEQRIFTTDPCPTVSDYSSVIPKPMWLQKVKANLDSCYHLVGEFVADVRLIFKNCADFNKSNKKITELGTELSNMFEKESFMTFNIQDRSRDERNVEMIKEKDGREENDDIRDVAERVTHQRSTEVPNSSHWERIKPEVSTEKSVSTYSLSSPAVSDEKIHIPRPPCLGCVQSSLKDLKFLDMQDCGQCLKMSKLCHSHATLVNHSFSHLWPFYNLIPHIFYGKEEEGEKQMKIPADVLVYLSSTSPLTFRIYLLPEDACLRRLLEAEEEQFRGQRLHKPRPVRPLLMNGLYALQTDCESRINPVELKLRYSCIAPNFSEVHIGEAGNFKMKLLSSADQQTVWQAEFLKTECLLYTPQEDDKKTLDAEKFLFKHRADLIQNVKNVLVIADQMLSQNLINREEYANIQAAQTEHNKMRKVFDTLESHGAKGKMDFFRILQRECPDLLVELGRGALTLGLLDGD